MPAHPSHSSNLSPLAPPFTVSQPQPQSQSQSQSQSQWSPFSGASFFPRPSQSAAGGEALYPEPERYGVGASFFPRPSRSAAGRETLYPEPEGYGVGPWDWSSPIAGGEENGRRGAGSSWLKAEGYCADSLPPLESSSSVWHENHLGSVLARPSAKGNFYPLAESSIDFNSCDTFKGYTANSCANLAQVHEPSSRITTSFADFSMLKNGYSENQYVNPYKTDTVFKDQNSSNLKEFSGNQFAGVKEFSDEMQGKSNMKVRTSMPVYTFSSKASLPSLSDLANEMSTSTSSDVETVMTGVKLKPLILPSVSIYESGLAEPSNSNGTSSQALDQINCYVDSPCWKRAPISRTSVGLNPSVRELTNIDNSETLPSQQVGTLICNEIVQASPDSPVVILPSLQNNLHDAGKSRSDCLKNNNEETNYNSDARMDQNRNSEENDIKATLDKDETVVSSIQPFKEGTFANNEIDLNPESQGSPSVNSCGIPLSGNSVELLVKSISRLSEVLLSSFIGGTNELKEQDHDLLELALHNLELVTRQSKKVDARASNNPSERKADGSQDMNLEPDGLNTINNITNHGINGKVNSSSNNVSEDGVKESSKTCMAQAFEKVFEEALSEQEENPQALIYKNLWIEAEASLCSMKYEVQRARMKMETEAPKHLVKGRSSQMPSSSLRNSVHIPDGGSLQKGKEGSSGNVTPHQSGTEDNYDLHLQKGEERSSGNLTPRQSGTEDNCDLKKGEERSSGNVTPHQSGTEDNCNSLVSCQETADKSEVLDASISSTLRILESPVGYSVKDQPLRGLIGPCVGTKEMIMPEYFRWKFSDMTVNEFEPHANNVNYSQYKGKGIGKYWSTSSEVFDGYNSVAPAPFRSSEVFDGYNSVGSAMKPYAPAPFRSSEVFDGYNSVGSAMKLYAPAPFRQRYPPIGDAAAPAPFRQRYPLIGDAAPIGYAGPSSEWEHVLKEDLAL